LIDAMDHAMVERVVFRDGPAWSRATNGSPAAGGDHRQSGLPPRWSPPAELAILIAPVSVDQFVSVNLARQKMPRKSTWFTPKARGGLVLADLGAES
jgi:hypothetical protein